jgi:hypothetical protein
MNRINLVELLTQQGLTARTVDSIAPDPDDCENLTTPPSSPTQGAPIQTNALLHQVMQRLVGMSLRTFETFATSFTSTDDHYTDEDEEVKYIQSEQRFRRRMTITPPSSPTFDGLVAPTPNTAMRAIKSSTFLRVSSLNPLTKAFAIRSPGEIPSYVSDFFRGYPPRT